MQGRTNAATSAPDFIAYQVDPTPRSKPIWSSVLVGVAWRRPDGAFEIQFSTQPITGLVKLSPHNIARRGNHAT